MARLIRNVSRFSAMFQARAAANLRRIDRFSIDIISISSAMNFSVRTAVRYIRTCACVCTGLHRVSGVAEFAATSSISRLLLVATAARAMEK